MERRRPRAQAVAIQGDAILAVGDNAGITRLAGADTRRIDCQGMALLPGFIDSHCHLLALAASLQGVDCGPRFVSSIQDLERGLAARAKLTPTGDWVRGFGYDHLAFADGRHPTRFDLDRASSSHPVRIDHRSGHAVVLNSRALQLAGIDRETPDPVDGVIHRKEETGEPTGLLLEMGAFLRHRIPGLRDNKQRSKGIGLLNDKLLSYGITSAQDAGPNNDMQRWALFRAMKESGQLLPRVTMMAGAAHLEEFAYGSFRWGQGDRTLRLGHAKVMLTLTTGSLDPEPEHLRAIIRKARLAEVPLAIHAIEEEAVTAAAKALSESPWGLNQPAGTQQQLDRIEHCAECPPAAMREVLRSGALVVTQPGFIYWNGGGYWSQVDSELIHHLYPIGGLHRASVTVAFGSDAPVIDPNPWPAIYSAVTRGVAGGQPLGLKERVSVEQALRMYTMGGAVSEGTGAFKGSVKAGKLADLVLVDADPTSVEPWQLQNIGAALTILGGNVVWERGRV